MSFALEIKHEVLNQEFNEEQALAFISGLIASSGVKDVFKIIIKMNNSEISNIIRDMMNQLHIPYFQSSENKNWVIVESGDISEEIKHPGHYFAGVFVGGGSISDPSSTSYHLEISFYLNSSAKKIQAFLNKYSFKFTLIQRRKIWVLYLKKSEHISDFLKAIQAFNSLLRFEDSRIERDFKNQLNRYSNLDAYNQQKLAKTTQRFTRKFNYIKQHGLLQEFRQQELDFFELKIRHPYSSLAELVDLYKKKTGITKTRSGLSHYLIKLRRVVENNK